MAITCIGDSKGRNLSIATQMDQVFWEWLSPTLLHLLSIKKGHNSASLSMMRKIITIAGICKSIISLVNATGVCQDKCAAPHLQLQKPQSHCSNTVKFKGIRQKKMERHFECKKYIWTNGYQREGSWTTTAELRNTREGLDRETSNATVHNSIYKPLKITEEKELQVLKDAKYGGQKSGRKSLLCRKTKIHLFWLNGKIWGTLFYNQHTILSFSPNIILALYLQIAHGR